MLPLLSVAVPLVKAPPIGNLDAAANYLVSRQKGTACVLSDGHRSGGGESQKPAAESESVTRDSMDTNSTRNPTHPFLPAFDLNVQGALLYIYVSFISFALFYAPTCVIIYHCRCSIVNCIHTL